jgi:hypothetical protein
MEMNFIGASDILGIKTAKKFWFLFMKWRCRLQWAKCNTSKINALAKHTTMKVENFVLHTKMQLPFFHESKLTKYFK